jgi:transposase
MGAPRMTMRRIKEILRMRMGKGQPVRDVARSMGVSLGAVSGMVARANGAGLVWPELEQMDDEALERLLYPSAVERERRPLPDFKYVHAGLRRKGVTLMLLWEEYRLSFYE